MSLHCSSRGFCYSCCSECSGAVQCPVFHGQGSFLFSKNQSDHMGACGSNPASAEAEAEADRGSKDRANNSSPQEAAADSTSSSRPKNNSSSSAGPSSRFASQPASSENARSMPSNGSKSKPYNSSSFPSRNYGTKGAANSNSANGQTKKKKLKDWTPDPDVDPQFKKVDDSRWVFSEQQFSGSIAFKNMGKRETIDGKSIEEGIELFREKPEKYLAMTYQTNMLTDRWPTDQCQYVLTHRKDTEAFKPVGIGPTGFQTLLMQIYQRLPPFPDNELPVKFRDKYTDHMTHHGRRLHSAKNPPILPGRGMGCGDTPNLKIIGDVDPSDIHQGTVGDCWLLSGISALAEFDGAIKKLFRRTKDLDRRPLDGPNQYTITLWDLTNWKEVDIVIDERLCADRKGDLLASKPSEDGELWVCYLEKALAAHCGGWDKITGGQCTHAWALMTGCRDQYTIRRNRKTGRYTCNARYNPMTKKWAKHTNSPHDSDPSVWQVAWPAVGGGGNETLELSADELFDRMCAWDKENFIVGAGTSGTSDKNSTDGMVDNHAYSVIDCFKNVAGTKFGMMKVRNPWGKGEIEDGMFDDDGPGWDKYPQIKRELKPVVADDGIFWLTKEEFFKFFETIYLSASNMTEFLED